MLSGFFCLCCGHTRFSQSDNFDNLAGALFMNMFVGVAQFATVILCLVGWCWSIGWGITMISISSKLEETRIKGANVYMAYIRLSDSQASKILEI